MKTISVFFSGTKFSIHQTNFLAGYLYANTLSTHDHIKMGFDGCGLTHGLSGTIFGTGLDEHCEEVIRIIKKQMNMGHQVTLNVYGHHRGGIAALMLAQQLSTVNPEHLSINLALVDPVPGNLISTATIDPLKICLTNKVMDLTSCKPLKKVLALYPVEPLPAIFCHAPLIASYPENTDVEEELVYGCNDDAEDPQHHMVSLRVVNFLHENGNLFNHKVPDQNELNKELHKHYVQGLNSVQKNKRSTHSARGVAIHVNPENEHFNAHHKLLAQAPESSVKLSFKPDTDLIALFNRFTKNYPKTWQVLKWAVISIGIGCLIFFTGGLSAIPLLPALITLLIATPIATASLATLYYTCIKPAALWLSNRCFYPKYSMRTITLNPEKTEESSVEIEAEGIAHKFYQHPLKTTKKHDFIDFESHLGISTHNGVSDSLSYSPGS